MASVKINSAVMRDKAGIFDSVAKAIKEFTDEMTQEIDRLRGTWEGDIAETTVTKFKGLADDFEERIKTINAYAQFLTSAADDWDVVHNESMQDAQAQQS